MIAANPKRLFELNRNFELEKIVTMDILKVCEFEFCFFYRPIRTAFIQVRTM